MKRILSTKRILLPVIALMVMGASPMRSQVVSTELHGDFRYSYNRADAGAATHWASANNASRLGVRGEVAGDRFTVFADFQVGVDVDGEGGEDAFTRRYFLAGVRGSFGTLTVGRHSTAYKMAGLRLDPFYDTSALSAGGGVPNTGLFAGASYGLSNMTNGWADRAVAYTSPDLHGFTANAATYVDTDSRHDYGAGLAFRRGGLVAGVQYHDTDGGRSWAPAAEMDHAVRGHAAYSRPDAWSLGVSWERLEARTGETQDFVFAAGTVHPAPDLTLAGGLGHVEDRGAVEPLTGIQPVTGFGYHAGVFYAVLPGARVHALYSHLDADDGPRRHNLALGMTFNFSISSSSSR